MRIRMKLLVVLVAVCIPLACAAHSNPSEWSDYLGNPERTGYSVNPGPDNPVILWEATVAGDFDTSPFIIDRKVLILWKDSMYHLVRTEVYLFDLLTGEILKETESDLFFKAFPVEDHILGVSVTSLHELDLNSGEFTYLATIPEKSFVATNMYPLVLSDRIIIPTTPAVCLSRSDFRVLWNLADTTGNPDLEPVSLAGDESLVIFTAKNKGVIQLLAVDPSTGQPKWKVDPLRRALWSALGRDTIYCGGRNMWAFSRDGIQKWAVLTDAEIVSNIVVGPDAVYSVDAANNVYKIDFDGHVVWKTQWEVSPWYYENHLIGAGNTLYCIGNYGDPVSVNRSKISAYNMEDGTLLWNLEFGSLQWIRAAPAVADGILVMGTAGGKVVALASDPDLFVMQGDAFLSRNLRNQAVTSYKKAAELYEKSGNLSQSQEIRERIQEIENPLQSQQPTTPPETAPASQTPEPTKPPESVPASPEPQSPVPSQIASPESTLLPESQPPQQSPGILISAAMLCAGILAVIFIIYYFRKKS